MAPWLPLPLLGLSLLSLPILLLARADGVKLSGSTLLPALFFAAYIGLSLYNPSHSKALDGSWRPAPGWLSWLPSTMDRSLTVQRAAPWLAALLQGGSLLALPRSRRSQERLLYGLMLLGLALTLSGALVWSTGAEKMYWFAKVPGGQFFATFIYKNHWVAFALPLACASLGLGFSLWSREAGDKARRNRRLLCLCAAVLLLASFPLPVSRSGTVMAALLCPFILAAVLQRSLRTARADASDAQGPDPLEQQPRFTRRKTRNPEQKQRRLRAWLFGGATAFAFGTLGIVLWLNWPSLEEGWRRSEHEYTRTVEHGEWNTRVYSARDTLNMAADRPWYGWGGGSFAAVFPLYQGDYMRDRKTGRITVKFEDAHCDWAQVLAEYGTVGLLLLAGPALLTLRALSKVGGQRARWVLLGCSAILVYALAEFPFQNPAVLLQWTVLACALQQPAKKPARALVLSTS